MCIISLCSITLSDSGRFGKVCEESHCALQGRLGPAESDGLHPKRGAYNPPSHTRRLRSKTNAVFKASEQETRELRSLRNFWLHWQFSTWHAKCYIDFLFSLGLLWDIALPSAHTGALIWVSPMGEAQTGRKESTDHVAKLEPAAVCSPFWLPPQFKCCGWNNYTDWSWNLYFNCTPGNPSSERCAVPYSCCTPVPGEVPLRFF